MTSWPRIKQATLADSVYEAVRDRILDGDLPLGEFIREQGLSEAMGVSRTPVREALGRLAIEGFLERIPHRGFRVPSEPFRNVLELYPILSALEQLAGQLALPALEPSDMERLRGLNEEMAASVDEDPTDRDVIRRLVDLNNRFHSVFSERSDNSRLQEILSDLRSQVVRLEIWYYSNRERRRQSVAEHQEIIDAIEAGDHPRALEHLERNMALTFAALSEETGLPEPRDPLAGSE